MEYIIHLAILVSIYAILAISLQLLVGYTGLLSVTHAAFYGIGAYVVALLLTNTGIGFFGALALGILGSALAALLIGLVLSKFRDDYYALGSLGFNVIVFSVLLNWQGLTRGPLGIPGISRPELFGFVFSDNAFFLLLALLLLAIVYAFGRLITQSSFGRTLEAIREDEEALSVFGYRTSGFKLLIFVLSAGMAAVAGALFASYITFIDPSSFNIPESIFMLSIIILGGLGTLRGAVLGALVLVLLPEALRFVGFSTDIAAQMRQLIYGLLLVLLMLYRPQGLVGKFKL
ncbi:MAG: branched-chain amino acid ABC transporter permease [Patescibacteria group bacterium]